MARHPFPTDRDGWVYLLSNLIVCDAELNDGRRCGLHFTGGAANGYRYYSCNGTDKVSAQRRGVRCPSRSVRADKAEAALWADLAWHIRHPQESLEELREYVRHRHQESAESKQQSHALQQRRHQLDQARLALRRVLREGTRSAREIEQDLVANAALIAAVQQEQADFAAKTEVVDVLEARLAAMADLLRRLHAEIDDIEATDDRAAKRRIIRDLVREIRIRDPHARVPELDVTYLFAPEGTTRRPSAAHLGAVDLPPQSEYL